jgi:dihydrofolate synthase/folylpolyglutamate synthase
MGGSWDATNVADGRSPSCCRSRRPRQYLGDTPVEIARREGRHHQARRDRRARRADGRGRRGAARARGRGRCDRRPRGHRVRVVSRVPAVGGQTVSLQGLRAGTTTCSCRSTARTRPRTPPSRWPRSRRSSARRAARRRVVREAFAEVTRPGRLEIVRRSPTIVLDAAHNPHGAEATAAALEDSFAFEPLIGVIGVMGTRTYEGVLAAFEPHLAHVDLHPELHPARCRPPSWPGSRRGLRRGPGHRRARPADAIDRRRRAGRGRCRVRRVDRSRRRARHRARWSPSARPARCCAPRS